MNICVIEGCEFPSVCRGLCDGHYSRWKKSGDVQASVPLRAKREKGQGTLHDGYVRHNIDGKLIREHQLIVEKALGKPLPKGAQIHHIDENKKNNGPWNLVLCPSDAYHKLLHARQRAIDACGNGSYRKCLFCKEWRDPETMRFNPASKSFYHFECRQAYNARKVAV